MLITGGSGFLGTALSNYFSAKGEQIRVLDLEAFEGNGNVQWVNGSTLDLDLLKQEMSLTDSFIHLAGTLGTSETLDDPIAAVNVNIVGGLKVLSTAAQNNVKGLNITVGNHTMLNPYSITKSTVERFASMYNTFFGGNVQNVRLFNVYGPGQSICMPYGDSIIRKFIPHAICNALVEQEIEIYGSGDQLIDLVHIDDVCIALDNILSNKFTNDGSVQEVGTGIAITVNEAAQVLADSITKLTGKPIKITYLPLRRGETANVPVIASKPVSLDSEAGSRSYREFADGVNDTIAYYHELVLAKGMLN